MRSSRSSTVEKIGSTARANLGDMIFVIVLAGTKLGRGRSGYEDRTCCAGSCVLPLLGIRALPPWRNSEEGELKDHVLAFGRNDQVVLALEGVEVADEVRIQPHGEVLLALDVRPGFGVAADGVVKPVAAAGEVARRLRDFFQPQTGVERPLVVIDHAGAAEFPVEIHRAGLEQFADFAFLKLAAIDADVPVP